MSYTHEVDNIEGELEHLRSVLKMNGYPKKFIDNAMKTLQHVREKTEYQSSVSLPYIGSASHKFERILKEADIQLYHSSENKLFRSRCTSEMNITGTLPQAGNLKLFVPSLLTQGSTRPKQNIFSVVLMRPDKTE